MEWTNFHKNRYINATLCTILLETSFNHETSSSPSYKHSFIARYCISAPSLSFHSSSQKTGFHLSLVGTSKQFFKDFFLEYEPQNGIWTAEKKRMLVTKMMIPNITMWQKRKVLLVPMNTSLRIYSHQVYIKRIDADTMHLIMFKY